MKIDYAEKINPEVDLFDSLEPSEFKKSKENLSKLIELYRRDRIVTFVGAGTSKPLGILDWKKLLSKLIDICGDDFKKENTIYLENDSQWQELAEKIYQELDKSGRKDSYHTIIKKAMSPSNNSSSLTLIKMMLAVDIHLTTNFDRSIENAYDFLNYISKYLKNKRYDRHFSKKYITNLEDYTNKNGNVIYYLHADIENDIFILRKSQYEKYYPSISNLRNGPKCIENCLRYFFINKNIVFIGFSFADKYVRDCFFKLSKDIEYEKMEHQSLYSQEGKVYNSRQKEHFLIVDSENKIWQKKKKQIFQEYEQYNIFPIIYKLGDHVFLEKLFEYLSEKKSDGI